MSATRTKIAINDRDIVVDVSDDTITLRRFGDRTKRVIAVEKIWEQLAYSESAPPPITRLTCNSIVAHFSRVRPYGQASLWIRADTGEELSEKALEAAGRREKRPVRFLWGSPMGKGAGV